MGTRGDVQPYVALAQYMSSRGHRAVVCTSRDFREFVRQQGVEWADMGIDRVEQPKEWLTARTVAEMLQHSMSFVRRWHGTWGRASYHVRQPGHPPAKRPYQLLWHTYMQACIQVQPDVICCAYLTIGLALDIAEKMKVQ